MVSTTSSTLNPALVGTMNGYLGALPIIDLVFAVAGAYLWDFFTSLDFEWSFIKRRKAFTWPMLAYFGGRYLALCAVCLAIYANKAPADVVDLASRKYAIAGGETMLGFLLFTSNGTNAFASLNLAIRAMAVWSFNKKVIIPLIILLVGQWGVVLAEPIVVCTRLKDTVTLDIAREVLIFGALGYTIVLDIIIFVLTVTKIKRSGSTRTMLMDRIWKDGLFYFALVIASNAILTGTVMIVSTVENVFPTAIIALMASSRLVRRVSNFSAEAPAVYLATEDTFAFQPVHTRKIDLDGDLLP